MTRDANNDYETYGINHNASKQEFQEPKAPEDFRKIEYYFEDFCELLESTGDEQILGKCEELSIGVLMRQELYSSKLKGFLEQRRAVRGILY